MADEPDKPAETSTADTSSEVAAADASKTTKKTDDKNPTMHIRVASPFKTFYDDEALSLSGVNGSGPFDILPHHHNFISLLTEGELAVKTKTGLTRVKISGGIMHVKADLVIVFLNV